MKVTSDIAKATLPDRKKAWRVTEPDGTFHLDLIGHEGDRPKAGDRVYDPLNPARYKDLPDNVRFEQLHQVVMEGGEVLIPPCNLQEAADRCAQQLQKLPAGALRLTNPHLYKVSITQGLHDLRSELMQSYHSQGRIS
jgi:nicotinate phosphoribosyltransferase